MPALPRPVGIFLADIVRPSLAAFTAGRGPLLWLLSVAIGLLVAAAAIAFRHALGLVQYVWLGTASERMIEVARAAPAWQLMAGPVLGGCLVAGLLYLLPSRRAGGVADVIEARAFPGRRLTLRWGLGNGIVSAVSLGAGTSGGREGPVVHMGAALASALGRQFRLDDAGKRTLLAAGVAAAVSTSFNAPIAGVLFAHEVILGHFAASAFVPITIASVIGAAAGRLVFGPFPAFLVPSHQITSYWEFPAFALLGLTCALVAIAFQASVIGTDRLARGVTMPLWLRPILGGVLVGAIGLAFPEVLGVGYEATDRALGQRLDLAMLIALVAAKTAATAITLASRFGVGVFSPALYLGAMAGAAFGTIAASAFPAFASSQGLYAILGMGAVAAAVLGAPISTAVMVFELTGGYGMTIAVLLTVSIANGVNQAVLGRSLFHWQLEMRGLTLQDGPHRAVLRSLTVRDVMAPLPEEAERAEKTPETVGEDRPRLLAYDTLETALLRFDEAGVSRIPVIDNPRAARLVGDIAQVDALAAYNRALVALSVEEHR